MARLCEVGSPGGRCPRSSIVLSSLLYLLALVMLPRVVCWNLTSIWVGRASRGRSGWWCRLPVCDEEPVVVVVVRYGQRKASSSIRRQIFVVDMSIVCAD